MAAPAPRFSVLVTATRATFLGQALASALAQTAADYEVLVGDDTPGGVLEAEVARFRDPRIRYLQSDARSQSGTLALLWRQAAGERLVILHDDDLLFPLALADLSAVLDRIAGATLAFGNSITIDGGGARVGGFNPVKADGFAVLPTGELVRRMLPPMRNAIGGSHAVMIDRRALPEPEAMTHYRGFALHALFDVNLFFAANRLGPIAGDSKLVAAYRQHPGQHSAGTSPLFAASLFEWELFIRGEAEAEAVTPEEALAAMPVLDHLFSRYGEGREAVLAPFRTGWPRLRARLARGDVAGLLEEVLPAWRAATAEITGAPGSN